MLDRLYTFPSEFLGYETREMLYEVLLPYRYVFPESEDGCAEAVKGSECIACTLGLLFRNDDAVKALAMCAKGRKKTGRPWPEVLAWLEISEFDKCDGWRRRWLHDGESVRIDRRRVRGWRECSGGRWVAGGLHEKVDGLDAVADEDTDKIDTADCEEEEETQVMDRQIIEQGDGLAAEGKLEEVSDAEWLQEHNDRKKRFNVEIQEVDEKVIDSTGGHAHLDEALEQNSGGRIAEDETFEARAETYLKLTGRIPQSEAHVSFQSWLDAGIFTNSSARRR